MKDPLDDSPPVETKKAITGIVVILVGIALLAVAAVVLAAGATSLLLTERYRVNTSAIFFLAPFRVFEFAIGASMMTG